MGSSGQISFLSLILASLLTLSAAQSVLSYACLYDRGNFTANSTYQANLNRLLPSFSSITENEYGFYNISVGQSSDKVNAISLCRGDVSQVVCIACITDATTELRNLCPEQKEAIIWYDYCMLRYSNRSIFGLTEGGPYFYMCDPNHVSDVNAFNSALSTLMDSLISKAASGGPLRKFATGTTPGSAYKTIYALVQCTPEFSEQQCKACLSESVGQIPRYCNQSQGGRVVKPSCNIRFQVEPFYDSTADAPPLAPPLSPPPSNDTTTIRGKDDNTTRTVIITVIPLVASVIITICCCIFIFLRRKPKHQKLSREDDIESAELLQFGLGTIRSATRDFSDANKLGQGGFGAVYKGTLSNGEEVAVKRLSKNSGQGDLEFKTEVQLVARLQHRNLVRLHGFCLEGDERLLIYEFVPNASLDHFLFDPIRRVRLDWGRRYKIIEGIARGILYLHEDSRLRIIHRDLKASNILLDAEMNPKISDFGMARLFMMDQSKDATSRIVGTYGYMAPEYAMLGQFSVKSDVYSFGVLVLEIVSGQKNNCFRMGENVEDLLSYAWKNWRSGTALNIMDPNLREGSRTDEILRCIRMGLLCVQENLDERPTMASIVLSLTSNSVSFPAPSQPAFFMHSSIQSNTWSPSQELYSGSGVTNEPNQSKMNELAEASTNDVTITDLHPR